MTEQTPRIIERPTAADFQGCCGKRVVLATDTELSFCGVAKELLSVDGREGGLVETDPATGFSFWCPLPRIKQITVIPISEQPEAGSQGGENPPCCAGNG